MADGEVRTRLSPSELAASIRDRVVRGEWQPGARLTEDDLADQYEVSRIPIREALRMLEADGFVTIKPYSGTFVSIVTPAEAVDLLDIRAALEPLGAERAAQRRTQEHLDLLKRIIEDAEASLAAGDTAPLGLLTGEFHRVVAQASGSAQLASMIQVLQSKIEWLFAVERPDRIEDSWTEHRLLMGAIERGDSSSAGDMMRAHVTGAHVAYRQRFGDDDV